MSFIDGQPVDCEVSVRLAQPTGPSFTDAVTPLEATVACTAIGEISNRRDYERLLGAHSPQTASVTLMRQFLTVRRRLIGLGFLMRRPRGRWLLGAKQLRLVMTLPHVHFSPEADHA